MRDDQTLSLPEEILLLALHDEKGTVGIESMYSYAVGGAVVAELALRGRIRLAESGKKKLVEIVSDQPTGKQFLDDCLARIAEDPKVRPVEKWVSRFAETKQLKHRLAQQLCDLGILSADEDKILLLFTRRIYPELDPRPERELVERLRRAVLFSSGSVEARTAVVISLAHHSGLLRNALSKKEIKEHKARIEEIGSGDAVSEATRDAIEAVQAAIVVACTIPSVAVVTST